MNVAFVDAHPDRFPVAVICRVLKFPERTFYPAKARPDCARALADVEHKAMILREWTANYQCYGSAGCTNISTAKITRSPGAPSPA